MFLGGKLSNPPVTSPRAIFVTGISIRYAIEIPDTLTPSKSPKPFPPHSAA